jgi:hypothetical protein
LVLQQHQARRSRVPPPEATSISLSSSALHCKSIQRYHGFVPKESTILYRPKPTKFQQMNWLLFAENAITSSQLKNLFILCFHF